MQENPTSSGTALAPKRPAKANKATVILRIQEVQKLLLAGGEFDDIRQYATAHGWRVSDRQLRRYQEKAYSKLSAVAKRDQDQLLGRHLMQRRALYARAMKNNDIRTALHVLRDEAALEGLYESAKQSVTLHSASTTTVSLRERLQRTLTARKNSDEEGLTLLEESSPSLFYVFPDTQMPEILLSTLAIQHAVDQLDHASMLMLSLWRLAQGDDRQEFWNFLGVTHGWRYRVGLEAWQQFGEEVGFDPDWLLSQNHRGSMLDLFEPQIIEVCPDREEVQALLGDDKPLLTPGALVREWRSLFNEIVDKQAM